MMVFHSALKKNDVMTFTVNWMQLKIIVLYEISKSLSHVESRFKHVCVCRMWGRKSTGRQWGAANDHGWRAAWKQKNGDRWWGNWAAGLGMYSVEGHVGGWIRTRNNDIYVWRHHNEPFFCQLSKANNHLFIYWWARRLTSQLVYSRWGGQVFSWWAGFDSFVCIPRDGT